MTIQVRIINSDNDHKRGVKVLREDGTLLAVISPNCEYITHIWKDEGALRIEEIVHSENP